MTAHRISTLLILLAALAGIYIIIPAGTEAIEYGSFSPGDLPTALCWVIVGLAVLQLFQPDRKHGSEIGSLSEFLRAAAVLSIALAMVWAMPSIGFLPASIVIASSAALIMYERRPLWLVLSGVGLPGFIWVLVTQLLDRNLP
ncbi:MAG: tripartite tricarboxylate transporter TctB family protein [Pseudomonadota bacterium]